MLVLVLMLELMTPLVLVLTILSISFTFGSACRQTGPCVLCSVQFGGVQTDAGRLQELQCRQRQAGLSTPLMLELCRLQLADLQQKVAYQHECLRLLTEASSAVYHRTEAQAQARDPANSGVRATDDTWDPQSVPFWKPAVCQQSLWPLHVTSALPFPFSYTTCVCLSLGHTRTGFPISCINQLLHWLVPSPQADPTVVVLWRGFMDHEGKELLGLLSTSTLMLPQILCSEQLSLSNTAFGLPALEQVSQYNGCATPCASRAGAVVSFVESDGFNRSTCTHPWVPFL